MKVRSAVLTLALLAWCGAAWAYQSSAPSIAPFTPQTRSVRPVVAAGLHNIYSLDASVLDIVSVAADPLVAGQYFLGSAFTDAKGGWTHVIAAVKR